MIVALPGLSSYLLNSTKTNAFSLITHQILEEKNANDCFIPWTKSIQDLGKHHSVLNICTKI